MIVTRIICCILFILGYISADAQIIDDFDQVELNTQWQGDVSKFKHFQGKLRSNSSFTGDQFEIKRVAQLFDTSELRLDIDLPLATSSANYIEVRLIQNDSGILRLKFGGTLDNISMEYWKAGKSLYTTSTSDKLTENSFWKIRCFMGKSAFFNCKFDNLNHAYNLSLKKDFVPNTIDSLGIRIVQSSSSFHFKHYFDNLYFGPILLDTVPPQLDSWFILDSNRIDLIFSEALDTSKLVLQFENALPINFKWSNSRPDLLSLTLDQSPKNGIVLKLHISDLLDTAGNRLDTTLNLDFIYGEQPSYGDVIFSELMIDPSPTVDLPDSEYIELVNISNKYLNLESWRLQDPKTNTILPKYLMKPGTHVLLVPQTNETQFVKMGIQNLIGLSSWPSLNNESDTIWLRDSNMNVMNDLSYDTESKMAHWKSQGGWSIELKEIDRFCVGWPIWLYSENKIGGSPGGTNKKLSHPIALERFNVNELFSVSADLLSFKTNRAAILGDSLCALYDERNTEYLGTFYQIGDNLFNIKFETSLKIGEVYTLHINGIYDCLGNQIDTTLSFGIPTTIQQGDIRINEILFNPTSDNGDYIELINVSDEIKDLRELMIVTLDSFGDFKEQKSISNHPALLFPHALICLTKEPKMVSQEYKVSHSSAFIACSLPSLPNSNGRVAIAFRNGEILEHFAYNENLHSYFIKDPKGVSLERRNVHIPVHITSNWTSASATRNYGTPGYENSQILKHSEHENFIIQPKVFSPNGDDVDDAITINFSLPDSNNVAYVYVYDVRGKIIKTLLSGDWVGTKNTIIWDGTTETKQPAPTGKYIVLVNCISLEGKYYRDKAITHLIR